MKAFTTGAAALARRHEVRGNLDEDWLVQAGRDTACFGVRRGSMWLGQQQRGVGGGHHRGARRTTAAAGTTTTAGSTTTAAGATTTAAATGATTTLPPTPGKGSAGKVTVFGVEDSENEAGAMQDALTAFGKANGIDITYVGRRDFEQQINAQVLAGNPPDIAAFPQPGKLKQFAAGRQAEEGARRRRRGGRSRAGPTATWRSPTWTAPSTACRSSPTSSRSCGTSRASGQQKGYQVPKTLAEFNTLIDKMKANGDTPLCVGIQSGTATGWPFTDWVEELVLRQQGIDYYNQWVDHQMPVQRPEGGRHVQRGRRPGRLLEARATCSRRAGRSPPRRSATTGRRWSRASA